MERDLESLFEVDGRPIGKNSIQALSLGPESMNAMVVGYDPDTFDSTWVSPREGSNPIFLKLNTRFLDTLHDPFGRPYLRFYGERPVIEEIHPGSLTDEAREIYDNWNQEVEKSAYGVAS